MVRNLWNIIKAIGGSQLKMRQVWIVKDSMALEIIGKCIGKYIGSEPDFCLDCPDLAHFLLLLRKLPYNDPKMCNRGKNRLRVIFHNPKESNWSKFECYFDERRSLWKNCRVKIMYFLCIFPIYFPIQFPIISETMPTLTIHILRV